MTAATGWLTGMPPVTGYYWRRTRAVERDCGDSRPFALAMVHYCPSRLRPIAWVVGRGEAGILPDDQWWGPLPLPPDTPPDWAAWIGHETRLPRKELVQQVVTRGEPERVRWRESLDAAWAAEAGEPETPAAPSGGAGAAGGMDEH